MCYKCQVALTLDDSVRRSGRISIYTAEQTDRPGLVSVLVPDWSAVTPPRTSCKGRGYTTNLNCQCRVSDWSAGGGGVSGRSDIEQCVTTV